MGNLHARFVVSDVATATFERRELHRKTNFSKRLVNLLVLAALNLVPLTTSALPQTCFVPCYACNGKKKLFVSSPSKNPYRKTIGISNTGEIGITQQGIKYDRCPLCDGRGQLERFNMAHLQPPTNVTDMVACPHCRACGVQRCRKCARKGLVACPRCANNKSGKAGWILVSERKTGERKVENRSGYKRREEYERTIIPCAFCNGIGVIECSECAGLGGKICMRCDGEGYVLRKNSK